MEKKISFVYSTHISLYDQQSNVVLLDYWGNSPVDGQVFYTHPNPDKHNEIIMM